MDHHTLRKQAACMATLAARAREEYTEPGMHQYPKPIPVSCGHVDRVRHPGASGLGAVPIATGFHPAFLMKPTPAPTRGYMAPTGYVEKPDPSVRLTPATYASDGSVIEVGTVQNFLGKTVTDTLGAAPESMKNPVVYSNAAIEKKRRARVAAGAGTPYTMGFPAPAYGYQELTAMDRMYAGTAGRYIAGTPASTFPGRGYGATDTVVVLPHTAGGSYRA